MGVGMSAIGMRRQRWSLRRLAWLAFNAVQLMFTLAWTAAWISLASLVRVVLRDTRVPLRMASRCWAPGLLGGAGARLQVEGLERVKQEMTRMPFVGWYARQMGMMFIERGTSRSSPQRLRDAVALVRGGAHLCAFPEGTRSRDGSVGAFKGGLFQVAIEAGVPVVPVSIEGSGAVLPSAGFRVRPGTIRLRFGTPLPTSGLQANDRNALARRAREAVLDLLHPGSTAAP